MITIGLIPSGRRQGPPSAALRDPQPPLVLRQDGSIVLDCGNSDPVFLGQMRTGFRRYVLADYEENIDFIMKDGAIYKNTIE